MKRLVTVFLILFWTAYVAIVAGGLAVHVFSEENEGLAASLVPVDKTPLGTVTLNATEVSKHSSSSSCWMTIDSKVYDITGYFGNHPAGDAILAGFCGKDANNAFKLSPHKHSAYATSLLASYLLGNLGETINSQTGGTTTEAPTQPATNSQVKTSQGTGATYTVAAVASHNTSGNCWIIVSNNVYNISSYLSSHPAGAAFITPFCGCESTDAFKLSPHVHSASASSLLSKYYIGSIGTTTTGSGAVITAPPGSAPTTSNQDDNEYEDD